MNALYFAGGCGVDIDLFDAMDDDSGSTSSEPARGETGGGDDEGSAPNLPLLVKHCQVQNE